MCGLPFFEISPNRFSVGHVLGFVLDLCTGVLVSQMIKKLVWGPGTRPEVPKLEILVFGLSHKQIEKLLDRIEAE